MSVIQMPSPGVRLSGSDIEALLMKWGTERTLLQVAYSGPGAIALLAFSGVLNDDDGSALIFRSVEPNHLAFHLNQAAVMGITVARTLPSLTEVLPAEYDSAPRVEGGVVMYKVLLDDGGECVLIELSA